MFGDITSETIWNKVKQLKASTTTEKKKSTVDTLEDFTKKQSKLFERDCSHCWYYNQRNDREYCLFYRKEIMDSQMYSFGCVGFSEDGIKDR